MKSLFSKVTLCVALLALVVAPLATTPGCAFLTQQRQTLAEMSAQDFATLQSDVEGYGQTAGTAVKGKLTAEEVAATEMVVKIIFEKSNQERAKLLAALAKDPQYQALLQPAIGAALDLIEAALGDRLELESLGTTVREAQLVEAFLTGMLKGMK
jgi:hypothetical protein